MSRIPGASRPGIRTAIALLLLFSALLVAPGASLRAQQGDLVSSIEAENAALASRISAEQIALGRERAELARLLKQREELDARLQRIGRHAESGGTGREFAVMVRRELGALPRPEQFAAEARQRERTYEATSDASIRAENEALLLTDMEGAVERRMAVLPKYPDTAQAEPVQASVRERLAEQSNLLERLQALEQDRQQTLKATGRAESELVQRSVAARTELTQLLFWLPSPERRLLADLPASIAWLSSSTHWQAAAAALLDGSRRMPFLAFGVVLLAVLLLGLRAHLRRLMAVLAARAAKEIDSRPACALKALAVTLALAAPIPLLCWGASILLASSAAALPFTIALGVALEVAAWLLFALAACVWLLDRHGLASSHFGWDEASVVLAGRALRRSTVGFVLLIFLTALNGLDHAPYENRESLGRLLFVAAMVVLAIFLVSLFRRTGPLMRRLAERSAGAWVMRLYPAWFWALLFFPLGMLSLAMAGYLTATGYFFGRTAWTLFLVIAAAVLYGLTVLWIQVRQWRLELGRKAQAAAQQPKELDLAKMGEQTRSLLNLTLAMSLLAGLWWIWKDALPALATIGDIALWSSTGAEGQPDTSITVSNLALAILIFGITWVVVRNVGALLDTLLLQPLKVEADANYAIKVVSRYTITAVGMLLAFDKLGIAWSDAQWLIAALGVGMGFGLQEIVANFISGLILLAERPVRIGDVVTVGEVTGKVSAIQARSTQVIDLENREVIIPNKAFITGRVVNWTLSGRAMRLLLKVGVASGSDITHVQQIMLEVVRSNPDVQRLPPPSVYFVGFREISLDFEIRAYVASLDMRLRVGHEIYSSMERALREHGIKIPIRQSAPDMRTAPDPGQWS